MRKRGVKGCLCLPGLFEKAAVDPRQIQKLKQINSILNITADTDTNIKKTMEAIMRIAYRIDGRKEK